LGTAVIEERMPLRRQVLQQRSAPRRALRWGLCIVAAMTLAACAGAARLPPVSAPGSGTAGLPHAVAVDNGGGRTLHVHVAALLDGGRFSSGFGGRRSGLGGSGRHHDGIDIAAPTGTPVRAAAGGRVVAIGRLGAYGRMVRLRHGPRLDTLYGHLSGFASGLAVGDRVQQDQIIGYVGSTGRSTGSHLHFEIRRGGRPIDPLAQPALSRGG
jgi:murein DD-endopeptidase MepM/ murein hydrolase activator NlpD